MFQRRSSTSNDWFSVDKEGLAKLLKRRGLEFILYELCQNSWDTDTTEVNIRIEPIPNRAAVKLWVEDNHPDGFKNLEHAFTLFAESEKKSDPNKRGRFNLGEKLVLALCERAEIISTRGSVYFTENGRSESKKKLQRGSIFLGTIRMTRDEMKQVLDAADLLIPPVPTTINGKLLKAKSSIHEFETTLPTEISDEEGFLRRTRRKTIVRIYEKENVARLYELGIPVVELEDLWTIEVLQKIPLNSDRDNVTPAFLRELRVAVVNEMHSKLTEEDVLNSTILETLEDERIIPEAVNSIIEQKYGEKRTVFDPSDPESNSRAFSEGYNVIPGAAFNKEQWSNIKKANAVNPSGKLFPTPKPYSDDPNAPPRKIIPEDKWTDGMKNVAQYAIQLGHKLIGMHRPGGSAYIIVEFENNITSRFAASYGKGLLIFNVGKLGKDWFNNITEETNALLIHEFAHEYEHDHLSAEYHRALCKLGAKLAGLCLHDPEFFRKFDMKVTIWPR